MRGSSFFEGIHQVDIDCRGEPGRTPTFYYDGASMVAVFPARYAALRRLMPDPRFVPARLAPGLGLVALMALEYRDTDLRPYNELGIAAVLNEPSTRPNFPGRGLVDAVVRPEQRHSFVVHLPVTTQVALSAGVDFFNFPKFLAGIDFAEDGNGRSCRLTEGREHILTLSARRIATPDSAVTHQFCHLFMDGQPQLAQFTVHEIAKGTCRRPGAATLTLGDRHPVARQLAGLLVATRSLQYELTPRMEGILFGPEHLTVSLIERSLHAVEAARRAPVAS